jgi:hypothetical protein
MDYRFYLTRTERQEIESNDNDPGSRPWIIVVCPNRGRHHSILGTILPDHINHAKKDPTIRYSFCVDNEK